MKSEESRLLAHSGHLGLRIRCPLSGQSGHQLDPAECQQMTHKRHLLLSLF